MATSAMSISAPLPQDILPPSLSRSGAVGPVDKDVPASTSGNTAANMVTETSPSNVTPSEVPLPPEQAGGAEDYDDDDWLEYLDDPELAAEARVPDSDVEV
jgi:hypothetical protein